jgi:hypothetical protein
VADHRRIGEDLWVQIRMDGVAWESVPHGLENLAVGSRHRESPTAHLEAVKVARRDTRRYTMKDPRTAALVAFLIAVCTACESRPVRAVAAGQQPASAAAPQGRNIGAIVDSLVSTEALTRGVPGVAVVIVADGEVLVRRGYGIADVASGRAVTEHTPFNIASVTKPFTAAVVQMLAGERRIRHDAPASTYLQLPSVYRGITVRRAVGCSARSACTRRGTARRSPRIPRGLVRTRWSMAGPAPHCS